MRPALPSPLPRFDRNLLRAIERIVPAADRAEWARSWEAELWHVHHRCAGRSGGHGLRSLLVVGDLSIGVLRDALWLRTESWRRAYSGTALLCVASLFSLSVLALLCALYLAGGRAALSVYLPEHLVRTLYAAPLVVFVAFFATTSHRPLVQQSAHSSVNDTLYRIKRQAFFGIKSAQVLLLAFLLSADGALPLHATMPNSADFLQLLLFVICSLVGLRWSLADQESRCRQCLHALTTPARVGRPSRNLLEWNGTELICKHGHGMLSVPEMETSWCQSSRWVIPDVAPFAGA